MDAILLKKYHGLGNDYLILDPNKNPLAPNTRNIELLCRRNFGVGADGILYGPIGGKEPFILRIYNPDGSLAERSGNGARIFAKYLMDEGYSRKRQVTLMTDGGEVLAECLTADGGQIRVDMGKPCFAGEEVPVVGMRDSEIINEPMRFHDRIYNTTCLSMGNPNCVIMMEEISKRKAVELGPYVERAGYFPNRMNLQLLKVLDRNNLQIEIYERGAGYTLASGTGACAAAAAARRMGLVEEQVTVHMPGGSLQIEIMPEGTIFMTGPVEYVGEIRVAESFLS